MKDIHARHEEYTCPGCGYKFDCATVIGKKEKYTPRQGDFSICLKCASVLRYAKGNVIMATDKEMREELEPDKLFLLLRGIEAVRRINLRST